MSAPQLIYRALRPRMATVANNGLRLFTTTSLQGVDLNDRGQSTAPSHRKYQKEKPLNPHLTNTTSTNTNEYPKVGERKAPPEMLTSADPDYKPADPVPGNVEHMTGGTQKSAARKPELGVGEIEGITFKVEPLKREGEDANTMRSRLLYQSRKRGILETDLLLSTFADKYLPGMTRSQMEEYDKFLDENDWDIYYWATQEPEAAFARNESATEVKDAPTETWKSGAAKSGEWAQTVGAFKPAYRPVPQRWAESETLALLKQHVREKSAREDERGGGASGGGLGRMPNVKTFE